LRGIPNCEEGRRSHLRKRRLLRRYSLLIPATLALRLHKTTKTLALLLGCGREPRWLA